MSPRPRHQKKDLERVLRLIEAHGWRVEKGSKYYKAYCPCGDHQKHIHLTPSSVSYALNLTMWFRRCSCWETEE